MGTAAFSWELYSPPCWRSNVTMSFCLLSAATCAGVAPWLSLALTSALLANSTSPTGMWPSPAA